MAKILICDDEEHIRLYYEEEFTSDGHNVVIATDGWSAIEMVEKEKPDLVILDIRMPGMDGIEALGKILTKDNQIPIIINSAYSSYKDDFMSWAADAYVIKSSDLEELKTKVNEVLGTKS